MNPAFDKAALAALAPAYPETPVLIDHHLSSHPLLQLDALIALAGRMRPVDVEYNRGDLPVGIAAADTPANGLGIEETIRSIETCGSWMVLKFVEQDPLYRALLDATLAEIEPVVAPATGPMLKREGFIFISSPTAVTPFHFDPEHNILLQVRGRKVMTVFPADDPDTAGGALHEAFHAGGHRNLPWHDSFASKGAAFDLVPGRGLYVPVKSPHWVRNGPEPSVSFSITWRSEWSYHEEYAHGFNRLLRSAGIQPAPPGRFPRHNRLKSIAYRAARRARELVRS
jgi:hypothetical protein